MNNTFGQHIINVLRNHDCVVLPEIGALVLKNIDAHIYEGQIFPAGKTIRFNKFIQAEDDLLLSELMKVEGLSYSEAKAEIQSFTGVIRFELTQKGFAEIEEIGRFSRSEDNGIKFLSIANLKNLDKRNYGLESLNTFPIHREIVKVEKRKRVIPKLEKLEKTTNVKPLYKIAAYGLVATFILMFGVFSLIMTNTTVEQLKIQNANVLNFFVPSTTDTNEIKEDLRISIQQENKKKNNKKSKKKATKSKPLEVDKNDIIIEDFESDVSNDLKSFSDKVKEDKAELSEKEKDNSKTDNESKIISETKPKVIEKELNPLLKDLLNVNSNNPDGYYVVVGAYSSLENANKAKYKCSIENTCKVFKTKKGLYRVAVFATENPEKALESIISFKKMNSSFWLMKNNL